MSGRYPGYDVEAKRDTPSWNETTREVLDKRLTVSLQPRFFTPNEFALLEGVCDRIIPQPTDRPKAPIAIYVDGKMADDVQDGYRYAFLPPQGEAWRRGLKALAAEAKAAFKGGFPDLLPERQDELLRCMQAGALKDKAWGDMPCDGFFKHRLIPDITHAYYALPVAWNEIGFGGPASPRGYVRMALNRRDPWEAVEAEPGAAARAKAENHRVR